MPENAVPPRADTEDQSPTSKRDGKTAVPSGGLFEAAKDWVLDHKIVLQAFLVLAGSSIAYIIVDPFDQFSEQQRVTEISDRWNASIATLGISPLFPPSEDFHVGDILLRIAPRNSEAEIDGGQLVKNLIGKSIRVGHIALPEENRVGTTRLRMTRTNRCTSAKAENGDGCQLNPIEVESVSVTAGSSPVVPAIVGFPGIEINLRGSASLDLSNLGFISFSRKESDHIRVSIPEATTFGASPVEAFGRLLEWCAKDSVGTKVCKERNARQLLAAAFGGGVKMIAIAENNPKSGIRCAFDVQATVVTRVYLTREIKASRNGRSLSSAAVVHTTTEDQFAGVPKDGGVRDYSGELLDLNRVYDRPLVIGYRSMSIALQPLQDEKSSCAN